MKKNEFEKMKKVIVYVEPWCNVFHGDPCTFPEVKNTKWLMYDVSEDIGAFCCYPEDFPQNAKILSRDLSKKIEAFEKKALKKYGSKYKEIYKKYINKTIKNL